MHEEIGQGRTFESFTTKLDEIRFSRCVRQFEKQPFGLGTGNPPLRVLAVAMVKRIKEGKEGKEGKEQGEGEDGKIIL